MRRKVIAQWLTRAVGVLVIMWLIFGVNYIVGLVFIGVPTLELAFRPRRSVPFESESWRSATFASGTRYTMAQDLILSDRLRGMTTAEVLAMLGPPVRWRRSEFVEILTYELAAQQQYPARSWLYPWLFPNTGSWELDVVLSNGIVTQTRIRGA